MDFCDSRFSKTVKLAAVCYTVVMITRWLFYRFMRNPAKVTRSAFGPYIAFIFWSGILAWPLYISGMRMGRVTSAAGWHAGHWWGWLLLGIWWLFLAAPHKNPENPEKPEKPEPAPAPEVDDDSDEAMRDRVQAFYSNRR